MQLTIKKWDVEMQTVLHKGLAVLFGKNAFGAPEFLLRIVLDSGSKKQRVAKDPNLTESRLNGVFF